MDASTAIGKAAREAAWGKAGKLGLFNFQRTQADLKGSESPDKSQWKVTLYHSSSVPNLSVNNARPEPHLALSAADSKDMRGVGFT
jgi:hypothetical protein